MVRNNYVPYIQDYKPGWLSELDKIIFEMVKRGINVPSREGKSIKNSLTRLRRNQFIINIGSRAKPDWRVTPRGIDHVRYDSQPNWRDTLK